MRCTLLYWRPNVFRTVPAQENVRLGNPPNPNALLPGQTSSPLAGEVWDPVVDHTSFEPGASADYLLISFAPTELSLGSIGTLLCSAPAPLVASAPSPGTPFAVPIPNTARVLGKTFCAQAASVSPGLRIRLTNALDCVIGN